MSVVGPYTLAKIKGIDVEHAKFKKAIEWCPWWSMLTMMWVLYMNHKEISYYNLMRFWMDNETDLKSKELEDTISNITKTSQSLSDISL